MLGFVSQIQDILHRVRSQEIEEQVDRRWKRLLEMDANPAL